jgi:hypothetical protein
LVLPVIRPILYKFYKAGTAINALEKQILGFTAPNRFNDPYELLPRIICHPSAQNILERKGRLTNKQREEFRRRWNLENQTSFSKAEFDKFMKTKEKELARQIPVNLAKMPDQMAKEVVEIVSRDFGILCLSKRWNHHLMWGHYSEGHSGFCIGYQIPVIIPGVNRVEVQYSQERYAIRDSDVLLGRFSRSDVEGVIRTKSLEWAYEEEVRYILNTTIPGIATNHEHSQFYIRHEPIMVKEIIAGIRCKPENVAKMRHTWKDLFPEAIMYQALQSDCTFEITRQDIDVARH